MAKWAEWTKTDWYRNLSAEDRESARHQYFDEVVAPQISTDDIDLARHQFDGDTKKSALELEQKEYEEQNSFVDRVGQRLKRGYKQTMASEYASNAADIAESIHFLSNPDDAPFIARKQIASMSPEQRQAKIENNFDALSSSISNYAREQKELSGIPVAPVSKAAGQSKTVGEYVDAVKTAPISYIADVGLPSVVQSAPALVDAVVGSRVGGKTGGRAGAGIASAGVDYAAELSSILAKSGVDTTDPDKVKEALSSPEFIANAKKEAGLHAGVVGLFDAISFGLASKTLAPKGMRTLPRELTNVAAQIPAQGVLGAAGEAGGQLAAGQELSVGEIGGELVGEMFQAPTEVAAAAYSGVRDKVVTEKVMSAPDVDTAIAAATEAAGPLALPAPTMIASPDGQVATEAQLADREQSLGMTPDVERAVADRAKQESEAARADTAIEGELVPRQEAPAALPAPRVIVDQDGLAATETQIQQRQQTKAELGISPDIERAIAARQPGASIPYIRSGADTAQSANPTVSVAEIPATAPPATAISAVPDKLIPVSQRAKAATADAPIAFQAFSGNPSLPNVTEQTPVSVSDAESAQKIASVSVQNAGLTTRSAMDVSKIDELTRIIDDAETNIYGGRLTVAQRNIQIRRMASAQQRLAELKIAQSAELAPGQSQTLSKGSLSPATIIDELRAAGQAGIDTRVKSKTWNVMAQRLVRGGTAVMSNGRIVAKELPPQAQPAATIGEAPKFAPAAKTDASAVPPDRRQDIGRRKAVSEMSQDELRAAILTDPLTSLPNRRAYEESHKKPVQVAIDADSLKWINDNFGHEAGDKMLQVIGRALKEQGVDGYHLSGDEFHIQGDNQAELEQALAAVTQRLNGAKLVAQLQDGTTVTKMGVHFSYGIGGTRNEADQALNRAKAEREAKGLRSVRGQTPPGVERFAAGQQTPENRVATAQEIDEEVDRKPSAEAGRTAATEKPPKGGFSVSASEKHKDKRLTPVSKRIQDDESEKSIGKTIESVRNNKGDALYSRKVERSADNRSNNEWSDLSYGRVMPRDLFNEAKVLSMHMKFVDDYNNGLLPKGFYVSEDDDLNVGLTENGDLYLHGLEVSYNGEPVTLTVPYNAGKETKFPLYATSEGLDVWGATVYTENGALDRDFISSFGSESVHPESHVKLNGSLNNKKSYLVQLGAVGLWEVNGMLPRDFQFDLNDPEKGFMLVDDGSKVISNNVESTFRGNKVEFFLNIDDNKLKFLHAGTEGFVLSGANGMHNDFKEQIKSTTDEPLFSKSRARNTTNEMSGILKPNEISPTLQAKVAALEKVGQGDFAITSGQLLDDVPTGRQTPDQLRIIKAVQETLKIPVALISTKGRFDFNGAYHQGTIWLNVDAGVDALAIFGHELSHAMESENPAAYKALMDAVRPLMQNRAEFEAKRKLFEMSEAGIEKEMLGDIMGDRFLEPEFWQQVAAKTDRSAFQKIASAIRQWLDRLLTRLKLRGLDSDRFVSDVEKAREIIAEALSGYESEKLTPVSKRGIDQTKTPEFKRWFGDSKVVDESGEPLVVYHGTRADFTTFNHSTVNDALGFHFGFTQEQASGDRGRIQRAGNADGRVMEAFIRVENPLWLKDRGGWTRDVVIRELNEKLGTNLPEDMDSGTAQRKMVAAIKAAGHDGVFYKNTGEGKDGDVAAIVFDPAQIKSATGNRGTFDPNNPNILYSRKESGQDIRTMGRGDLIKYARENNIAVDSRQPTSQLRAAIERAPVPPRDTKPPAPAGGAPSGNRASWDAPEPGKLDTLIYTLQDKHIDTKRVIQAVRNASGALTDVIDVYLQEELYHGRASKSVNDFLDKELRPLLTEMSMRKVTMADLQEYLHARHAEERNEQIAKINPDMPDGGSGMDTKDAKVYLAKLEPQKKRAFEALAKRVDDMNRKTRQELVAYGLESEDTVKAWEGAYKHYVPLQREEMEGGPGIGQGFSVRGSSSRRATGSDRKVVDILANIAMQRERAIVRGEKNRVANALIGLAVANPNSDFWKVDRPPVMKVVDERTGLVVERVDPLFKNRDNVIVARAPSKPTAAFIVEHAVIFNERDERAMRMAQALKNLDAQDLGELLGTAAKITRFFASINTQYNPVFGVVNLVRDTQGAMFNLTTTPIRNKKANVMRYTMDALRGIYIDTRATRKGEQARSSWADLWEEFQREGGQTGYRDMFRTSKDRAERIEREIERVTEGKAKQFGRGVFDWLSDYNTAMENAVRLAAYKVAKESGISNQRAASIAKNLTVNFNRKGQIGTQAGALYAFFNASVQGTSRLAETLTGPAGKKIIAGGLLLGSMQALLLAAAGFDDDEPPEFVRERNVIIPIGGKKYVTIPMPLGLHILPNLGRIPTEFVLRGFREPAKNVVRLVGVFAEAFNPIGNAGLSLQTIAPTAIDPIAALAENKDWTGKPIAREDFNKLAPTPGHARAKDTASAFSKAMSKAINWLSGGTNYTPGIFSPTPDQIDYLIGQVTGGLGREAMKVEQTVTSAITGEELPTHKIPLLGRLYGSAEGQGPQSNKFYENLKTLNAHEAEVKGRARAGEPYKPYMQQHPESDLIGHGNNAEQAVGNLRQEKRRLISIGASKDKIKLIDQRITKIMSDLNEKVKEAKGN